MIFHKKVGSLREWLRVSFLVIFIGSTILRVEAQSANPTIKMRVGSVSVSELFQSIEQQSGFRFARDSAFEMDHKVDVVKSHNTLTELMKLVMKGTGRGYVVVDKTVIIQRYKEEPKQKVDRTQSEGVKQSIEREMQGSQSIHGRVIDVDREEGVEGATILLSGVEKTLSRRTVEGGEFKIDGIAVGEYTITVEHPAYESLENDIIVAKDESKGLVFAMNTKAEAIEEQTSYAIDTFVSENRSAISKVGSSDGQNKGQEIALNEERLAPYQKQRVPRLALKTNLFYDAITSFNLGLEVRLSDKMTLDIPVNWKPYNSGSYDKMFRHFMFQPELRWWREAFNGHFLGAHLLYSQYNVGGFKLPFGLLPSLKNIRYEGDLYGVGVSYGYHTILSNRISLEFTAGLGYAYLDYDKYNCLTCKDKIGRDTNHYFGLTKLGVTFIIMLR